MQRKIWNYACVLFSLSWRSLQLSMHLSRCVWAGGGWGGTIRSRQIWRVSTNNKDRWAKVASGSGWIHFSCIYNKIKIPLHLKRNVYFWKSVTTLLTREHFLSPFDLRSVFFLGFVTVPVDPPSRVDSDLLRKSYNQLITFHSLE